MNGRRKPYHGEMTLEKAAMMRQLHQAGALSIDLMRAFGVCYTTTTRIVHGKIWVGRPCKGCWRHLGLQSGGDSGYCDFCKAVTCQHCQGPKSPGRRSTRCATCDRANFKKGQASRTDCRECGETLPPDRRDLLCSDCRHDQYEIEKKYRNNRGRRCSKEGCENPLPEAKSWRRNLCRPCAKENDRLRRSLSRRQCGICGRELNHDKPAALCYHCLALDRRIQRKGLKVEMDEFMRMVRAREQAEREGQPLPTFDAD